MDDGTFYHGDFYNGIPHGKGVLAMNGIGIYDGYFQNGKFNGNSKLTLDNGN